MSDTNKNKLTLSIVTPSGEIFDGAVDSVVLPGCEGEFGVLPKHSALVTSLSKGIITIKHDSSKEESVVIDWGYCEVENNKVYVLANGAVALNKDSELSDNIKKANKLLEESKSDMSTYASEAYLKQEIECFNKAI